MGQDRRGTNWARTRGKRRPGTRTPAARRDVSASLLALSNPLLDLFGDAPPRLALEVLALETALIWNVAVHERVFGDADAAGRFLESGAPPGAPPELAAIYASMLDVKRAEAPFDARWIVRVRVVDDRRGEPALRAEWTDELSRAEAEAVIDALRLVRMDPGTAEEAPAARRSRPGGRATDGGRDPWRPLLESAKWIHTIAPWNTHLDRDVFGLRIDGEEEVHWCSVMGAGGEFFGVALYRGGEGFDALRRLAIEGDGEAGLAGFDGYLVTFNDREELTAGERRRIKASGVRFRGRGAWPQLLLQRRGRLAADLPDEDAARLRPLLGALVDVLELRCSDGIPAPVDLAGELPVYTMGRRAIERRYEVPAPAPEAAPPHVDRVAVGRLVERGVRTDRTVEFGGAALEARVADDEGFEYVPYVFLVADPESGALLEPRVCEIGQREVECASHLLAILARAGEIPREVRVATGWIGRGIAPTLEALGVRLVLRPDLPAVDAGLAAFGGFLGGMP